MKTLLVALLVLLCATFAFGQSGHLDGTVTDPTGAAVPGADVTVTAVATHSVAKTTTSEKGEWTVAQLDAGAYDITISKPGFKMATINGVTLAAGSAQSVVTK